MNQKLLPYKKQKKEKKKQKKDCEKVIEIFQKMKKL